MTVIPAQFGSKLTSNPDKYIDPKDGLRAAAVASDVIKAGPLAEGDDEIVWAYESGVWRPGKHVVRDRVVQLLGDKYRRSYTGSVEDIVRQRSPKIDLGPVEQYINFANGLLDWRTGELHPHTPDVMSTCQMAVPYTPTAVCPQFDAFLASILPEEMIPTAWEMIGYLMYSGNPLHTAILFYGGGRNGKGTLLRVITAILGVENISAASLASLSNNRFAGSSLLGKIANIAGDIDGTYLDSTETLKKITGLDTIRAERKGRDGFDYTPWAVPVFSANRIPASADVTDGYLGRWLVIEFPYSFFGREDRGLDDRLRKPSELAGVAAKAVPALRRLLERHQWPSTEIGKRTKDKFERDVDQVKAWADDCLALGQPADCWVNRTELYAAYKRWALRDGYRAVKASEFYHRLESLRGIEKSNRANGRGFKGVTVTDECHSSPLPI